MPSITRILCPVDFSEPSDAAFQYADDFASSQGAELVLLHAFYNPISSDVISQTKPADAAVTKKLNAVASRHDNVSVVHMLHAGPADEVICWAAEDKSCDLIIMGTHGRKGLKHFLLGSTAEYVLKNARCPVLTIRPQEQNAKPLREPIVTPLPAPPYM